MATGLPPIYVVFSEPLDSGIFTRKQLDRKFKHAKHFGVYEARKNSETLTRYKEAVEFHLNHPGTIKYEAYLRAEGSKVYFNRLANNVVVIDLGGVFVFGWKLEVEGDQVKYYLERGVLQ